MEEGGEQGMRRQARTGPRLGRERVNAGEKLGSKGRKQKYLKIHRDPHPGYAYGHLLIWQDLPCMQTHTQKPGPS